uniref:Uncharacterized protein n=1 Tax=Physcomitrium patens TaxID=3218 RepID=A0A2K1IJH4_PHYPA|nr:hypothetical protein PHYPA_028119 [Physcomitrium patens]
MEVSCEKKKKKKKNTRTSVFRRHHHDATEFSRKQDDKYTGMKTMVDLQRRQAAPPRKHQREEKIERNFVDHYQWSAAQQ